MYDNTTNNNDNTNINKFVRVRVPLFATQFVKRVRTINKTIEIRL